MRSGLKSSKALGVFITLVQLGGFLGFAAGMHTVLGVFYTAIPTEESGFTIEQEMSDPAVISISLTPRNNGYLEAKLSMTVSIVADGDQVLATDHAEAVIPPGQLVPLELELTMPLSAAMEHMQEGGDASWVMDIEVTSLYELLSFSNKIINTGGGE